MPSSHQILEGLAEIANGWQVVAIAWHLALGSAMLALIMGWRPSRRLMSALLAVPLASVSLLASSTGNPFNGIVFAVLATALGALALSLPPTPVRVGPPWQVLAGGLLFGFGWVYPHFLTTDSWTTYLYAAPTGLLPCPTLSVVLGISLMLGGGAPRSEWVLLAAAGLLYGLWGAFGLGVTIDLVLVAGALVLAGAALRESAHARRDHPQ